VSSQTTTVKPLVTQAKRGGVRDGLLEISTLTSRYDKLSSELQDFINIFGLGSVKLADNGEDFILLTHNSDEFARLVDGKAVCTTSSGKWPDPTEYVDASVISSHLSLFENDDIVRITSKTNIENNGGTLGGENAFVTTKKAFDKMWAETEGDLTKIGEKMGFDDGYLEGLGDDVVFAVIKRENVGTFKMPTGNEGGANSKWLPGGKNFWRNARSNIRFTNSNGL
jgi:hypothetical protein